MSAIARAARVGRDSGAKNMNAWWVYSLGFIGPCSTKPPSGRPDRFWLIVACVACPAGVRGGQRQHPGDEHHRPLP